MVLSALAGWGGQAIANESVEFEDDRKKNRSHVASVKFDPAFSSIVGGTAKGADFFARFEQGNVVQPGEYSVDVYVNNAFEITSTVQFRAVGDDTEAQPCFTQALLRDMGVDFARLPAQAQALLEQGGDCMRLPDIIPDAFAQFVFNEQRLNVSIPQVVLRRSALGYVDPEHWSAGETAGMLNYNANLYSSRRSGDNTSTQAFVSLGAGVNLGLWRLRHEGTFSWSHTGASYYNNLVTYVRRDLTALKSQLTIGESYTSGELFDSTSFRGVQIASDDRMLPQALRGYAPVVRGVANTNAKVTIRQNGRIVHETTVAPGNFEIDDLYAIGYGGDLEVSINEADGSVRRFTVPYAAVPLALRAGINRYSFVAGTVRDSLLASNPLFAQATWQRGLTDFVTGYGGLTAAQGYMSVMLGGALNTQVGAFGFDITHANTSIPDAGWMRGTSMRASFSKLLPQTGTNFSLAAYRYSTNAYLGLNDAMRARESGSTQTFYRQRSRGSVTLNQKLGETLGYVSLSASTVNYWNRPGSDLTYTASYSKILRNIAYSATLSRTRNAYGQSSTQVYLSASIPLGKSSSYMSARTSLTHDSRGTTQTTASFSGAAGQNQEFSYDFGLSRNAGGGYSSNDASASVLYRAPYAELSASAGLGPDYQQGSLSVRGAAVAHAGGITLSQPLGETFAIVKAPHAAGAQLYGTQGVRVDSRGYAIMPYLTPYVMNTVDIDTQSLSMDVELKSTHQRVAPRAGAIPLLEFATSYGMSAIIDAHHADGSPLPFGAAVLDHGGNEIGSVGQGSRIFVRGTQDKGMLSVRLPENRHCAIHFELPAPKKITTKVHVRRTRSTCTPHAPTVTTLNGKTDGTRTH